MSTPNIPLSLRGPQMALLSSIITYPLVFLLVTPRHATASRFTKSREAISVLHCTLVTLLSAYELQKQSKDWDAIPTSRTNRAASKHDALQTSNGASCPLIATRSALGNSIAALEMGYLVQDAVILILAARLRTRERGKGLAKEINWRVLGWHHAGLSTALAMLQWYIARGREKGIMVILMLMLMNASTPIGTLHWYLVNFQPSRGRAIMVANAAYLLMYGVFRVSIVPWILHVFGSQTGYSAMEAFLKLRMSCLLGTATIGISNSIWFILGIKKFVQRYQRNVMPRKGI
ncbi:TLC domain-containing protein [Amylocarpus encephaloides]|uniref:TLC domain-containing protein n=1 Tax=Amylocarpus encephaloides TaxID=45428 RepID=A0A9P7YQK1_9HELO|nr:TLC domain-containing protein [Amylocarpus encephaloides]